MPKDAGPLLQFVAHRIKGKIDFNASATDYLEAVKSVYIIDALEKHPYVPKPLHPLMEKAYLYDLYIKPSSPDLVD